MTSETELADRLREKAKESLYFFAKGVLGYDWLVPNIHLPLCKLLEDYKTYKRLRVTLPRGWLKTTVCSCAYPLWRAINNPSVRVLLTQNTFTNACSKLRRIKGTVEKNPLFRALFSDLLPDAGCVWKGESLCLRRPKEFDESTFEAAGTGTQVTSRHYDVIIEDDTVAPDVDDLDSQVAVPSKDDIEKAIGWHKLATPLLNNPAEDQILVVGTRWGERDLLSWVDENEKYDVYQRAAREDCAGNPDPGGRCVYPERFGEETLEMIRRSLGPYMYSSLYMNSPMASENMTFRQEWVRYYETEPLDLAVYTTVDLASDPERVKKQEPDYNVVMTCGKHLVSGVVYVLDYWRKRANPGEVIEAIFAHVRKWKPIKVGIESVAYQSTLQYWVRERMRKEDMFFVVEDIRQSRRKVERILGLQPLVAGGELLFKTWMRDLIGELLAHPLGAFDDLADCLSMQLGMWRMTRSARQAREEEEGDGGVMTLVGAINSIKGRVRVRKGFPFDVVDKRYSLSGIS